MKGQENPRNDKKKPQFSLKEKRARKHEKKEAKSAHLSDISSIQ